MEVAAEAHAHADNTGIADVHVADVTVEDSMGTTDTELETLATVFAKTGTEADAHIEAETQGVNVGAEASIGNSVGVEAEGTESIRPGSVTGEAGVSVGDHFEAGGSAEATFRQGVTTVVGVDADAKVVAHKAAVAEKGVEGGAVESTAKKAVNSIIHGIKKFFKKLKF